MDDSYFSFISFLLKYFYSSGMCNHHIMMGLENFFKVIFYTGWKLSYQILPISDRSYFIKGSPVIYFVLVFFKAELCIIDKVHYIFPVQEIAVRMKLFRGIKVMECYKGLYVPSMTLIKQPMIKLNTFLIYFSESFRKNP